MSDFDDDMNRGYLENGELLEARWGAGPWSPMPEQEPEFYADTCPYCGGKAVFIGGEFVECDDCGRGKTGGG